MDKGSRRQDIERSRGEKGKMSRDQEVKKSKGFKISRGQEVMHFDICTNFVS